jgi:CspA family cold shock protein
MAMNPALKRQFEAAAEADEKVDLQKQARGREIGTVQMYDKGKGFGFIIDSDKEKLFVHQSQIVSSGFRCLIDNQKVSFLRGENRGKPWAEDVRNPDGSSIMHETPDEAPALAKKWRQQLKEQWRNFFEIPQYALKGYGESLPATVSNQDTMVVGDSVPQLGKVFVLLHGCCATASKGNECTVYLRDKMAKFIAKAYEEKADADAALSAAFEVAESEWMERAKMKSLTDGAEVMAALFVHALNSSGQPCVQLWVASVGACTILLCGTDGQAVRVAEPQTTAKERAKLVDAGYNVNADGSAEVAFAEVGEHKPTSLFKLPAARLLGARPFKTSKKSPVP